MINNEQDTNVQEVASPGVAETTEETTTTTEEEQTETVQEDTVTIPKSDYTKLKRQAIAYKSQKENSPVERKTSSPDSLKEELYLIAEGLKEKDIEQLAVIAKGSGVGLREAKNSELFKLYQEKQLVEARKARSNIGASTGSGYNNPAPIIKPNMTDAEHNAAWKKVMSGK